MKRIISVLVLGVLFLSSCSKRDYKDIKKDSVKCVQEFLQAVLDEKGNYYDNVVIVCPYGSPFEIAKQYNPHWNPTEVSYRDRIDTIVNPYDGNKHIVVYAKHNGKQVSFKVWFPKQDNGNGWWQGKPYVVDFTHYIKYDFNKFKKDYGFVISDNIQSDIDLLTLDEYALDAAKTVNNFLSSLKAGYRGTTYYPALSKANLKLDSLFYQTTIDTIGIQKPGGYTMRVVCHNGMRFSVEPDGALIDKPKWIIVKSEGLIQ